MHRQEYWRKNSEDATGMCLARLHFAVTMLLGETVKIDTTGMCPARCHFEVTRLLLYGSLNRDALQRVCDTFYTQRAQMCATSLTLSLPKVIVSKTVLSFCVLKGSFAVWGLTYDTEVYSYTQTGNCVCRDSTSKGIIQPNFFLFLSWCDFVCVCVRVCMNVFVHVCVHVCASIRFFFNPFFFLFFFVGGGGGGGGKDKAF